MKERKIELKTFATGTSLIKLHTFQTLFVSGRESKTLMETILSIPVCYDHVWWFGYCISCTFMLDINT